jgi:hypothetical protein
MKIQIIFRSTFIFVFLFTFCSKETENSSDAAQDFVPIPQKLLNCFREAGYLEDIFKADTLKLQSAQGIIPVMIRSIHFSNDGSIYIGSNSESVLEFDRTGRMIKKIGRKGQGPGEYISAWYVNTNSRGELIILDSGQRKITISDKNGSYLNSFRVHDDIFEGLFISAQDEIIINTNFNGRRLQRETINVYSKDGQLLRKFGSVSDSGAKLKDVPFLPQASGYLALYGEYIFEADYPDYKIKKYNKQGRLVKQFGSKPKEWRSLLDSGYEKLPPPQTLTPTIQEKLLEFLKEFRKYAMVHWITSFRPGILAMMIKPSASPAGGEDTYFVFYDVNGNLLSDGLAFRHPFQKNKNLQTEIISTTPEGFCVVQYHAENTDVLLIRMRIKTDCLEEKET